MGPRLLCQPLPLPLLWSSLYLLLSCGLGLLKGISWIKLGRYIDRRSNGNYCLILKSTHGLDTASSSIACWLSNKHVFKYLRNFHFSLNRILLLLRNSLGREVHEILLGTNGQMDRSIYGQADSAYFDSLADKKLMQRRYFLRCLANSWSKLIEGLYLYMYIRFTRI